MPNSSTPRALRAILPFLAACAGRAATSTTPASVTPAGPSATATVSADGGWVTQNAGTRASLRGVSAVSARVVWASGSNNTILRSVDGGITWQRVRIMGADSLDFRSIQAFDEGRAMVASAGDGAAGQARIYVTNDGGASWRLALADSTKGVFFDALKFWDDERGIALSDPVGGRFVVFATDDGGATWWKATTMPAALEGEAAFAAGGAALAIAPPAHAWFVTGGPNGSRVYHTADRGRTWTVSDAPLPVRGASAGLFGVDFRNAEVGVAVGGDYRLAREGEQHVARTDDGGRTWTLAPASPATTGYWSGISYAPGTRGGSGVVAVGLAGTMLSRDDGATWTRIDTTAYNAVSFASPSAGWAVGPGGRVAKWRGNLTRR